MTILDALNQTLDVLNGINVPVPQLRTIGMPIEQATELIQATVDAIKRNEQAEQQKKEEAEAEESAIEMESDEAEN